MNWPVLRQAEIDSCSVVGKKTGLIDYIPCFGVFSSDCWQRHGLLAFKFTDQENQFFLL